MPTTLLEQTSRSYNDNRFSRSNAALSFAVMIATISSTNAFAPARSNADLLTLKSSSTANALLDTKQKTFKMAIPFSFCFDEFAQPQCHFPLEAPNT